MKKFFLGVMVFGVLIAFVSCTKSSALTGGSSGGGSFGNSINGSVNGGLSPVAGATVTLMLVTPGGSATAVASATTGTNGAYTLIFTNPSGNNLLYLTASGGNAGSGTNSNNQFMTIVGTTASFQASQNINEITTAAAELTAMNMGLLTDTNGSIAIGAPNNAAGATNVATQFYNLIANGNLNTANSNLTSSTQTGLKVMANAFAMCIQTPSKCSTLFNTASSSTGSAAVTLLESGYNALNNSANNATPLYSLAFPLNNSTGFTLTSSSAPSGFSFNNALPVSVLGFPSVNGATILGIVIDASGNVWAANFVSQSVSEFSPTGALIGTFSTTLGSQTVGMGIDAVGNIWASTGAGIAEFNPAGTVIGTFGVGGGQGLAIDAGGNVWTIRASLLDRYNSSGTLLSEFSVGAGNGGIAIDSSGNGWVVAPSVGLKKYTNSAALIGSFPLTGGQQGIAIDQSGNVWVPNTNTTITEYNSSGVTLGTFSIGSGASRADAIDSTGKIWVTNSSTSSVMEFNSSGLLLANYAISGGAFGVAIDASGNIWSAGGATLNKLQGVTQGPAFFPVVGPVYSSCF